MMVKTEQNGSKAGPGHIGDDIHELGVSCREINLNQFDRKTYDASKKNRE